MKKKYTKKQIQEAINYWLKQLKLGNYKKVNESKTSYFEMYMMSHPKDKLETLIESLIKEFATDIKKHKFDMSQFIVDRAIDFNSLDTALNNLNFHYHWHKIKAQTYAAIITRSTASSINADGQKYNENEIQFNDVRRGVSRKVLEECLNIICHNTNVLEANGIIRNACIHTYATHTKVNVDILKLCKKYNLIGGPEVAWGQLIYLVYAAWASYGKGRFEKFVCDSDNGPEALKKVLNSCPYDGDDLELAVTLNRAVDTVHTRSDLANAFIEGGAQTCAMVSNLPDKFVL